MALQLRGIGRAVKQARVDTAQYAKSITPIDTGYARDHTSLKGDRIVSDYPYAKKIMLEGGSKQLARGEYVPKITKYFMDAIRRYTKKRGK